VSPLDGGNQPFALLDQLNLARPPGLVVPGLERSIEAEDCIPALAGTHMPLDPIETASNHVGSGRDIPMRLWVIQVS
jgi:hypothetical protein